MKLKFNNLNSSQVLLLHTTVIIIRLHDACLLHVVLAVRVSVWSVMTIRRATDQESN
jgi:hypothetical protein